MNIPLHYNVVKFAMIQKKQNDLEKWIMVLPFIKCGKVVDCPYQQQSSKATLPLNRVVDTVITITEVMKLHSNADILNMARRKNKYTNRQVDWHKLEFH
jgi:hypothetical protein